MVDSADTVHSPLLLCTFRLAERWFGVEARWVKEVSGFLSFTPVPHTPSAVRGYVNLRGNLTLVLDLQCLWTNSATAATGASRLLVFKPAAGESFALVADEVDEIAAADRRQIEATPTVEASYAGVASSGNHLAVLTIGFAKLPNRLITVLDPCRILDIVFADPAGFTRIPSTSSHPHFQVGRLPDA